MPQTRYCQDYKDKKGCGKELQWKKEQGVGKFNGYYVHKDTGIKDCGGHTKQEYQNAYAPQIEAEDSYSQGLREAQSNTISERFINEAVRRITEAVSKADRADDKAHTNNLQIAEMRKDVSEIRNSIGDIWQKCYVPDDETTGKPQTIYEILKKVGDLVSAHVKQNSFTTGSDLLKIPGKGELKEVEQQQEEEEREEEIQTLDM